jgi:hypothetical protein
VDAPFSTAVVAAFGSVPKRPDYSIEGAASGPLGRAVDSLGRSAAE